MAFSPDGIGLAPQLTPELNGTQFTYTLRDTTYQISLRVGEYQLCSKDFLVKSAFAFGVGKSGLQLYYYPNNLDNIVLTQYNTKQEFNELTVRHWQDGLYQWISNGKFVIQGLTPGDQYEFQVNKNTNKLTVSDQGTLSMEVKGIKGQQFTLRQL